MTLLGARTLLGAPGLTTRRKNACMALYGLGPGAAWGMHLVPALGSSLDRGVASTSYCKSFLSSLAGCGVYSVGTDVTDSGRFLYFP